MDFHWLASGFELRQGLTASCTIPPGQDCGFEGPLPEKQCNTKISSRLKAR